MSQAQADDDQYKRNRNRGPANASEKYYDCLQCAEQCRHDLVLENRKNICNNNNSNRNNYGASKNINSKTSRPASVGNRGKNVTKNSNKNTNQNNKINAASGKNQKDSSLASTTNKNRVQKINNLQAASAKSANKTATNNEQLESYLMSVKDPSIRRWLSKSSNNNSYNEARLQHLCDKQHHQRIPSTPARKRSSLARPVRIHDSFSQENEPAIINWHESQNLQNQHVQQQMQIRQRHKADKSRVVEDQKKRNKKQEQLEQIVDDVVEIRVDEEITMSPIRLRLGEFFELSLPKCRKRKRRRRHRMMIATMREKTMKSMLEAGALRTGRQHAGSTSKDTEHLLKVLSINNVDQDNRYNVTRCSVM